MKKTLYALVLSVLFFSCQQNQENSATYTPRVLNTNEKFNGYLEGSDSAFKVLVHKDEASTEKSKETYKIKFKDTLVKILINKADPNSATENFSFAQFVNTQKTTLLVQIADNSGLAAPCYIVAFKDGKIDVASLYRASSGKQDRKYTTGLNKLGRSGYVVNNDFFITNVNAQVYLIKRQNPEERIQGDFLLISKDKSTLAFLTDNSLYQVHYSTDEVWNEPFSITPPQTATELQTWVANNFTWKKNKKGIDFLRFSDSDRLVDIREFQ